MLEQRLQFLPRIWAGRVLGFAILSKPFSSRFTHRPEIVAMVRWGVAADG